MAMETRSALMIGFPTQPSPATVFEARSINEPHYTTNPFPQFRFTAWATSRFPIILFTNQI